MLADSSQQHAGCAGQEGGALEEEHRAPEEQRKRRRVRCVRRQVEGEKASENRREYCLILFPYLLVVHACQYRSHSKFHFNHFLTISKYCVLPSYDRNASELGRKEVQAILSEEARRELVAIASVRAGHPKEQDPSLQVSNSIRDRSVQLRGGALLGPLLDILEGQRQHHHTEQCLSVDQQVQQDSHRGAQRPR